LPIVNTIELARYLNRDSKAVRVAVENGRLTPRPDGLFDLEAALKQWAATTHHEKGHNNRSGGPRPAVSLPPGAQSADLPSPEIPLRNEARSTDYAKARAGKEVYEALTKKLNYETRAGRLTPTEDVENARYIEARVLRDACQNIPARIAAQLAGESSVERCQQLLEAEITSVFQAFADGSLS